MSYRRIIREFETKILTDDVPPAIRLSLRAAFVSGVSLAAGEVLRTHAFAGTAMRLKAAAERDLADLRAAIKEAGKENPPSA